MKATLATAPGSALDPQRLLTLYSRTAPLLAKLLGPPPPRLLVVSAPYPMWHGGLSGEASFFVRSAASRAASRSSRATDAGDSTSPTPTNPPRSTTALRSSCSGSIRRSAQRAPGERSLARDGWALTTPRFVRAVNRATGRDLSARFARAVLRGERPTVPLPGETPGA